MRLRHQPVELALGHRRVGERAVGGLDGHPAVAGARTRRSTSGTSPPPCRSAAGEVGCMVAESSHGRLGGGVLGGLAGQRQAVVGERLHHRPVGDGGSLALHLHRGGERAAGRGGGAGRRGSTPGSASASSSTAPRRCEGASAASDAAIPLTFELGAPCRTSRDSCRVARCARSQ
ncbi:MAG: hypothetical protein MZV64_30245 [Ignavibacteriales bacterium]|nr:hypothetical protein [Ignavibacteriales bacterium]